MPAFRIPKFTDEEIVTHLQIIAKDLSKLAAPNSFTVIVHANIQGLHQIQLPATDATQLDALKSIFAEHSQILTTFWVRDQSSHPIIRITRNTDEITDTAAIEDQWGNGTRHQSITNGIECVIRATSMLRKELMVAGTEASFSKQAPDALSRYMDAQMTVTQALQNAAKDLIVSSAKRQEEVDTLLRSKSGKLEAELAEKAAAKEKAMEAENQTRVSAIEAREKELAAKEAKFETMSARYHARDKQQAQLMKIEGWLNSWNLTKGTEKKRIPVLTGYIVAALATAAMTCVTSWEAFVLISDKNLDLLTLSGIWIWAKPALPFAAFISFMVYFIKWTNAWAKTHADEELRYRSWMVDIGRSSWLLESVRDAKDADTAIPPELLRELSKNMFQSPASHDGDMPDDAFTHLLSRGLSKVRIKSPDGSEFEATKEGKK